MSKTDHILKYDWLVKSPSFHSINFIRGKWKPGFFVLTDSEISLDPDGAELKAFLSSYRSENDYMNLELPKAQYCLDYCTSITADAVGNLLTVITLKFPHKSFCLVTKSEDECIDWLRHLRSCRFGKKQNAAGSRIDNKESSEIQEETNKLKRMVIKNQVSQWRNSWASSVELKPVDLSKEGHSPPEQQKRRRSSSSSSRGESANRELNRRRESENDNLMLEAAFVDSEVFQRFVKEPSTRRTSDYTEQKETVEDQR